MINTLIEYFRASFIQTETQENKLQQTTLATAVLLVEMVRMDHTIDERENTAVLSALQKHFDISQAEGLKIMAHAEQKALDSTDYYQFTSLVNQNFSYEDKVNIIESLWRVAFSDLNLDKYEEHYLRKIADLFYIKHKDFIQTKHKVMKELKLEH